MFALHSRRLRRRLSAPTSGSARRRARERRRAEQNRIDGERLARQRVQQRMYEKMEQQRLARDQLLSYEPWGRAGGGAPNPSGVRYSDLRAFEIYPEDELRGINQYEACRRWPSPHARGRRRTPLRLREDPLTLYTDALRKSVDNDVRYRQTPDQQKCYKEILDDMVIKKNKALKDEKKKDREFDRRMQKIEGPWGKPGPGGTTWRNPRDVGLNFSKSMGWTDNEIFSKMKGDHKRDKRSSLTLPKVKRDDDSSDDLTPDKENVKPSNVEKLPDIEHTNSASKEQRKKLSAEKKEPLAEKPIDNLNNKPNDKLVDKSNHKPIDKLALPQKEVQYKENGNRKKYNKKGKFIKRLPNGERLKRMVPDEDIVKEPFVNVNNGESAALEKKLTPEASILRLTGGIELVPLLARRRRVGARTLPSSDVTRPPEQPCEWRESLHAEYLRELKKQIQVKYEKKEESRIESAESVRRHHATWESMWGRPGHGAPLRGKYARSNLAQLLYVTPSVTRA